MKNKLLFLVIIYCAIVSPLFAQTTTIHTLDEATVQIAPVPAEQNGIHPATDYNTVTKPLLYEPFTTNPPFLNSAADIYPPAGSDRTYVFLVEMFLVNMVLGLLRHPLPQKKLIVPMTFPFC